MYRAFALCGLLSSAFAGFAEDPPLAHFYGFQPPEIYKLDQRVQNLVVVDLNGDGLQDVVAVNNLRNRLDVLMQLKSGVDDEANIGLAVNDVPTATRMKLRKIEMQRPVGGLSIHDVNGDNRPDLVYVSTEPPSLNVEFQNETGQFGDRRSFEIEEILAREWTHDVGDVNGDGVPDIVFLGKENLYVIEMGKAGRFSEPRKFRLSGADSSLLRVLDVDGDSRNDIVFATQDPQFPLRLRLQDKQGRIGPEHQIEVEKIRAISWGKIDASKPGANMLTVSDLTSRVHVYRLGQSKAKAGLPATQFLTYPFEKSSAAPGGVAVADFDGDGRTDVAAADPTGARILFHRQIEAAGLDLGKSYPAMVGVSVLKPLILERGPAALLVFSPTDKAVGIVRWAQNRLLFPELLPTKNEPVAIDVVGRGVNARVVYVARVEDPVNFTEKFLLRALGSTVAGERITWAPKPFGDKQELELSLSAKPSEVKSVDVNGDGKDDLLFFIPGEESPTLWLGQGDSFVQAAKTSQGALAGVAAAGISLENLEGEKPTLLVSQGNYIRKMTFDADGRWKIQDQVNAPTSSAKVQGSIVMDLDGDGVKELVLYDRTGQSLEVLKQRDGRWERFFQRKIGAFALKSMHAGDFDGDGKTDLLLCDNDKMGVLLAGKTDLAMESVASYESNNRRGQLFDVTSGDLNGDGRPDLLAMDSRDHTVEIISVQGGGSLKRATSWPVFEEKTFRSSQGRNIEPREIAIGDVNGDSRQDILALVHDRLIVYIQDSGVNAPGKAAASTSAPKASPAEMKTSETTPKKTPAPKSALASSAVVQDSGRFFKVETVAEARKRIDGLLAAHSTEIAVESFSEVPEKDRTKFQQLVKAEQDKFIEAWAKRRATELKTKGVYILICRKPTRLYVHSSGSSVAKATVEGVRQGLIESFRKSEFDRGLLEAVRRVETDLKSSARSNG